MVELQTPKYTVYMLETIIEQLTCKSLTYTLEPQKYEPHLMLEEPCLAPKYQFIEGNYKET